MEIVYIFIYIFIMSVSKVDLNKINNLIVQEVEILEQKALSSLPIDEVYIIKNMSTYSTRFGKSILLTLQDVSNDKLFKTWLPKRISLQFSDDDISCINSSGGKYTMVYLGQSQQSFAGMKTRSLVKFNMIE
ncbi:hypothetical protein GO639_03340 [Staphylococcus aureus]|nr:hypothetical protein [Staphylococcus aureus]